MSESKKKILFRKSCRWFFLRYRLPQNLPKHHHQFRDEQYINYRQLYQHLFVNYDAPSFPNSRDSNLQRYRDWSCLNCRRKVAYNFSLRTWKEVTQEKFASGYKHGVRWCYVRSCVVTLVHLLANRFSATTMEKRCFGPAGGVFPLNRPHFLAGVLNFCSVYILWKILRRLLATKTPNTVNKSIRHCHYFNLDTGFSK